MERRSAERWLLCFLMLLALGVFGAGINWGLPGKDVDRFLFGDRIPWTGEEILKLLPPEKDDNRGADVDANPIVSGDQPIVLNETDQQRAEIVRRYRLFSYQPDEMITLMALSKMKPSEGRLDPKLYQYGGLWMYPVGALLKASSMAGLVQLKSDQAFYLDHPAEFGKFYIVMRGYVLAWAMVGVWAIYWLARRLTPHLLAAFAATVCCIFLPVVVNMAHEAKPHLPGAVLMLLAIVAATKFVETGKTFFAILCGVICGAAFGMIISGLAVFILLPAMVLLRSERWRRRIALCALAAAAGVIVYGITNPYVIMHLFGDRETLFSNLGNSKAMYSPSTSGNAVLDAFVRLSEGCSLPLLIAGLIGEFWPRKESNVVWRLMTIVCAPILIQFVLLAHNKPSEFARFALLPCICIAMIGVITFARVSVPRIAPTMWALMVILGVYAASYVWHFGRDAVARTPRIIAAERLQTKLAEGTSEIYVRAEPAPYCLPPVDLFKSRIILRGNFTSSHNGVEVRPVDLSMTEYLGAGFQIWPRPRLLPTPISWASKPMRVSFWKDGRPMNSTTQSSFRE